MSMVVLFAAADDILSASFVAFVLNTTLLNSRSTLVENSWLASFLWCLQFSPSVAKIPSPKRSFIIPILKSPCVSASNMFRTISVFYSKREEGKRGQNW
ncbi:hypothetical protein ACP4OV_017167 [Aristida adscensionis]